LQRCPEVLDRLERGVHKQRIKTISVDVGGPNDQLVLDLWVKLTVDDDRHATLTALVKWTGKRQDRE